MSVEQVTDQASQAAVEQSATASELLVLRAGCFAMSAHGGQKRKFTGRPYFEHPMRVAGSASLLPEVTDEVVAAGWLHDVIEDCGVTAEKIHELFGPEVCRLVVELTEASLGSDLPRVQRKQIDLEYLARTSQWARRLKMLDRIDNLNDMQLCDDQEYIDMYLAETDDMVRVLVTVHPEGREDQVLLGLARHCLRQACALKLAALEKTT